MTAGVFNIALFQGWGTLAGADFNAYPLLTKYWLLLPDPCLAFFERASYKVFSSPRRSSI